ncbi:hypothetical protein JVX92_03400 [Microbacterium hominis]|uniref:hypothetical protein n=1 Tax=Microbacterium hominis TaxID=162426 RepID=UPI0019648730|nr:hypothetical protein [Microbacterium hominis]QRY41331.1 hypothetical protein JVX92_03400 [Microbacterium hominis]
MTDEKPTPDPADDSATEDATVSVPAAAGPDDEPTAAHAEQPATEPAEQPAAQSDEQPAARPAASDDDPDVSYATFSEAFQAITDGPDGVDEAASPQYGVGPFSVREVSLGAIWLVAFVVSFFPIYSYGNRGWGPSAWTGIDWVLTIGVPTVAVFLIGLRRLSPQGIRRVGSLGIDQFASVAFTVSSVVWLGILWSSFVSLGGGSVFLATWVVWVEFILMLAGVVLTVFAPLLPTVGEDFRYRTEVPAHRYARPARPVVARPAAARPAFAAAPTAAAATGADAAAGTATGVVEPVTETTVLDETVVAPAASQAFWALAPVERDVVDENDAPLFRIGPTAWALVIEDRGDTYVVRHEDGRVGYLTDVSGVTRG